MRASFVFNFLVFSTFLFDNVFSKNDEFDPLFCVASCLIGCGVNDKKCADNCENRKPEVCSLPKTNLKISNLVIDYGLEQFSNRPYETFLTWEHIPKTVYVLQWRTLDLDSWNNHSKILQSPEVNFTKSDGPCAIYTIRIIPVTKSGAGSPSDERSSGPAVVHYNNKKDMYLNISSMSMVNDSTLEVNIVFDLAIDWKYPDVEVKVGFHQFNCPRGSIVHKLEVGDKFGKFLVSKICVGAFFVAGVKDICSRRPSRLDHTLGKQMLAPYDGKKCSKLAGCLKPRCTHHYACGVDMNLTAEASCYADLLPVNVSWSYRPRAPSFESCGVVGLYVQHGYASSLRVENPVDAELKFVIRYIVGDLFYPVETKRFVLYGNPNDTFVVRGCAVFNEIKFNADRNTLDFNNSLEVSGYAAIDLTEKQVCVEKIHKETSRLAIIVGPLIAALVCLLVVSVIVYVKARQQSKKLKETEAQQNFYEHFHPNGGESLDIWEIDRRLLTINEDETLGKGAFGKVFKGQLTGRAVTTVEAKSSIATVQETADNMIVAIKQCHEIADDQTKRDFLQEIELMKKLFCHPRLVNIVHCITKNEPYSLIVEFCEKGDLLRFLRNRREYMIQVQERGVDLSAPVIPEDVDLNMIMSFKEVATMSYQVADGMEYISQNGYIHRDLAARNILVTANHTLKIGDFGLCRYVVSDAYMTRGGKLPVKWLAFEALETYEFSSKSDVWSYGVLLFEIITLGGVPYANVLPPDGDFRAAMLDYLGNGNRMEQPCNCPDEFYKVMDDCWKKSPGDRPTFTDLKDILRDIIKDLSQIDNGNYSDFYIDPTRKYYNVVHPDDEHSTAEDENPKIYPFRKPTVKTSPEKDSENEDEKTGRPRLVNTGSIESGIGIEDQQTPHSRVSLESFNSTAPLISPKTPNFNKTEFPILHELSGPPLRL